MPKMWSETLKSGNHEQANGVLYDTYNGAKCCMGVLEVEAGIPFDAEGFDVFGANEMPAQEIADFCLLSSKVTTNEMNKIHDKYGQSMYSDITTSWTRTSVFAMLNDEAGLDFEAIADFAVEFGWDVDLDALRKYLIVKGVELDNG